MDELPNEPDFDEHTRILGLLMRIDAKLDELLRLLEDENGEEEEEPDA